MPMQYTCTQRRTLRTPRPPRPTRSAEGEPQRAGHHGGHRHHRSGRSGGLRGGFPFGGFGPGAGPPWRGGRKARRGDIRTAALLLLAEEPRNGYQIMQEVRGAQRAASGARAPARSTRRCSSSRTRA